MRAASSSSRGIAIRNGRRITTVMGSANAAWGRATPHHVLPSCEVAGDQDEQRDDRDRRREQQPEHEDHEERLAAA